MRAFVNDGSHPQLVMVDFLTNINYQFNLRTTNAWDPDVVITYDKFGGRYFVHIVYLDLNSWQYIYEKIEFIPGIGLMTGTASGVSLFAIAPNSYGSSGIGNYPSARINIDVNAYGELGAITFQDPSTNKIYGCGFNAWGYLSAPVVIASSGIEPDVACVEDFVYFTYVDLSSNIPRQNIIVQEENQSGIALNNITHARISALNTSGIFRNPRIASNTYVSQYDWTVVTEEHILGINNILGITGNNLTVTNYNNYTNSSTWANSTTPNYIVGNGNGEPVVSYGTSGLQVAWTTTDNLNGLSFCAAGTVVGLICNNSGAPVSITNGCGNTGIFYTGVPFTVFPVTTPPLGGGANSPIVYSHVFHLCMQNSVSLSGRNSNSFMTTYSDRNSSEVLFKDGYTDANGFRQAKPKTENLINSSIKAMVSVSPNPFTESIKITSTNNDAVCNLIITDISGRILLNTNGTTEQLNSSLAACNVKLQAGIYFINIKNESGILLNQKIVKQ